jgi:vesicle transport through interaction with t-SNAREs protein 1
VVAETETIGENIMTNMNTQRGQLEKAAGNVSETRRATDKAKKILKGMAWRAVTNKIILWLVILFLLVGIGLVVYFDFVKAKPAPAAAGTTAAPGRRTLRGMGAGATAGGF